MAQYNNGERLHDQIPTGTDLQQGFFIGRYLRTTTHADVYSVNSWDSISKESRKTGPWIYQQLALNDAWQSRIAHHIGLNNPSNASLSNLSHPPGSIMPAYSEVIGVRDTELTVSHRDEAASPCSGYTVDTHTGLEARVYDMTGLGAHDYSRRSRAIKRLESRTVFKSKWNQLQVVVYCTGAVNAVEPHPKDPTLDKQTQQRIRTKTARQRESQRLRQYDRRRAKTVRKAQQDSADKSKATFETGEIERPFSRDLEGILDRRSLALILVLYLAFEIAEEQRRHLPTDTKQITNDYLKSLSLMSMETRGAESMHFTLDRKDCELVVLKRLLAKLPSAERWSNHQVDSYRQHAKGSSWIQLEDSIRPALAQHQIIQAGYRTVGLAIKSLVAAKLAVRELFRNTPDLVNYKTDLYRELSMEGFSGSQRNSKRGRYLRLKDMEGIQGKELSDVLSFQFN